MAHFLYLTVSGQADSHLSKSAHPLIRNRSYWASVGKQKGGAMTSCDSSQLSSQELGERFDLLANDAKEYAVFVVGLDGNLLCWNAGAERIFGYQSHEIMG